MITHSPALASDAIVETAIELARCSKFHRIIVAGSKSLQFLFALHRHGFNRVVAAEAGRALHGRYEVGFVDWRLQPLRALEAKLIWIAPFLSQTSVLVLWFTLGEALDCRLLGSMLERQGFRLEVATRCAHGFAVSARRRDAAEQAVAA